MSKSYTITIIHNDEAVRSSLQKLLTSRGFGVESFVSVEQFIGSNRLRCAACIILDIHTPGMGGLHLQSHLASAGLHIPMIFITASFDERTRTQAVRAGAIAFLHKPLGEEALLREIRSALSLGGEDERP